jgi:beta-lactamase regulating signal transducer with metallopeptidase domain
MKMNLLISHEWLQQLAGTLLHFLWQGALVAFLCAVLLRLLAARSSILRYSVAVASLGVMTLLPIMTFILYPQTHEVAVGVLQFFGSSAAESGRSAGATNVTWWSGWIVRAWGIGVCLGGVRLVAGWMFSRRLVRSATTHVPARVSQLMERVREVLVGSRRIRLLIGERVDSPVIFGWLRPVILLPVSAITGLTEDQLMAVIAHEVAHIRRHDFIVNAAQRVVESVLFYHPALWWLSARVRAEREHCCDDLAVQLCGNQFVYAEALLELERTRTAQSVLAVPAAAGNLGARVRRVLGVNSVNRDWQPAAVALLLVAICVLAGAWQSETIAAPARAEFPAPPPPLATQGTSSAVPAPETSASVLGALTAIVTAEPPQRGAAIPPVPATSIQLTVELRDGSRIVGKSNDDSVEVRSAQLGAIRLPIDKIRLIEWSATPEPAKLTTSGGEVLAVQFVTKEVRVET